MTLGTLNYYMKVGNRNPDLTLYLEDDSGRVPDLSGALIEFFVWTRGSATYDVVDGRSGSVADVASGEVKMAWEEGDTDVAGVFSVLVDVIKDSKRETFPAKGTGTLVIEDRPPLSN